MRISDGSSDVCSSDLADRAGRACGAPGGDPRLRVRSWRRARSGSAWRGPQEGICSMSAAAAEDWTRWVGRSEQLRDAIAAGHAQAMQATLDDSEPLLHPGDPLPPLWHWAYFWSLAPTAGLGPDGHAARDRKSTRLNSSH